MIQTLLNKTGTISFTEGCILFEIKLHANYKIKYGYHFTLRMTHSTAYHMMPFMAMAMGGGAMTGAGAGGPIRQPMPNNGALASVDRVRNVFPETWLWSNTTTGYMK